LGICSGIPRIVAAAVCGVVLYGVVGSEDLFDIRSEAHLHPAAA
jgi:hypothetical protein